MVQRTLWGAIDRDRRRWIRAGALVVALLGMLAYAVWIVATSRSVAAWQIVARVLVPLAAILMFPLVRTARDLRTRQAIGAVPVATGMLPDTKSALHDVSLAAGLTKPPTLLMYFSDAVNAFVTRAGGGLSISVSSGFAGLSRSQQRAGMAMLVGRIMVDTTSFAAEHQFSESLREDPIPPDRDPTLFTAWLDAAVAGDREGLKILGEPVPMIELLELLSITSTIVPEFAYADGHDAVFGFLAWPYVDSAKVMAEEFSVHGKGMPAKAAAAVAALIAEERSMSGSLGFVGALRSSSFSGAEALRALRLREVSGAEGAIAGSTAAAATRRDGRAAAAVGDGERAVAVGGDPSTASEPEPITGSVLPTASPALAFADTGLTSYGRGRRLAVRCPACQASNAPGNRDCIACGRRLPRTD
jgi:hypothetical protein